MGRKFGETERKNEIVMVGQVRPRGRQRKKEKEKREKRIAERRKGEKKI